MRKVTSLWRSVVDVREGERVRTAFMALYLLATLFSYYIMKPAARGMFLGRFKVDELPLLNILLAVAGGVFAYLYTRLAVKTSLRTAVDLSTALSVTSLALLWWLLGKRYSWMLYVFSVWVSMFSIVMVTQCWLVAANLFNPREAKRVYTLLGLGAVTGAAFGGTFTSIILKQKWVGQTQDLLWWAALWIAIAYAFFRVAASRSGGSLSAARAAEAPQASFGLKELLGPLARQRHLQVIISITLIMLVVDVIIEFQLNSILKQKYESERAITAFLALYTGTYLNAVNFVFQFFLTALVVRFFGVGGTLQIMPATIAAVSAATLAAPGVVSTTAARLAEATTRYTLNRTGMELLYLPLPLELRNRTKAFIDIFVDRLGRGVGGLLLLVLVQLPFTNGGHNIRPFAGLALVLAGVWSLLSWRARNEYVATIRKRIEARRLDLESVRVRVQDPATIGLLEQAASSANARQATYALSLLAEAPGYDIAPLLAEKAASPLAEVRGKVFEIARALEMPDLLEAALREIRSARGGDRSEAIAPAAAYAVSLSPEGPALAARLLDHPNILVARAAVESLEGKADAAQEVITYEWLTANSRADSAERRCLAAVAIRVRGDEGTEALHHLLADPDPSTAAAACEAAGKLGNRSYLDGLLRRLGEPRVRRAAIDALAAYGVRITGTLADVLNDPSVPRQIRRHVPRVLSRIPHQRSVDILIEALEEPDLLIRNAVLRALGRLRESHPGLTYGAGPISRQIMAEARGYCQLNAALAPFRNQTNPRTAAGLLAATLAHRLEASIERLFRLLGLRYPPKEIYATYVAVNRKRPEEYAAALEFLDNVLDRDQKRFVLPLLDESNLSNAGRELFGIAEMTAESAIRELIRSGDAWLTACAMAAAGELRIAGIEEDIRRVASGAGAEVGAVARAALARLN